MSFFIPLLSNSSQQLFPENSIGKYNIVKLPTTMNLGDHKAELADIQYPNSWNSISNAFVLITSGNRAFCGNLRFGTYIDINNLLKEISDQLMHFEVDGSISFDYNKFSKRITLNVANETHRIRFSKNLSNILGLEGNGFGKALHQAKYPIDMDEGMTALYAYSNIIQMRMVGSVDAQLLRIIPLTGDRQHSYEYKKMGTDLRYHDTINTTIDLTKIDIRREDGLPVTFESEKVIVTLAFKKIRGFLNIYPTNQELTIIARNSLASENMVKIRA